MLYISDRTEGLWKAGRQLSGEMYISCRLDGKEKDCVLHFCVFLVLHLVTATKNSSALK